MYSVGACLEPGPSRRGGTNACRCPGLAPSTSRWRLGAHRKECCCCNLETRDRQPGVRPKPTCLPGVRVPELISAAAGQLVATACKEPKSHDRLWQQFDWADCMTPHVSVSVEGVHDGTAMCWHRCTHALLQEAECVCRCPETPLFRVHLSAHRLPRSSLQRCTSLPARSP